MTYRSDSDIWSPYGHIQALMDDPPSEESPRSRPSKPDLAFWVASNCLTVSHREQYILELERYFLRDDGHHHITTAGKCGETRTACGKECLGQLAKSHKFYLAFENSLCRDYITEKFWRMLGMGVSTYVRTCV